MAEHQIRRNGIIYIIPTDELFLKLENDEAFIDDYGRLINRKPHRVLKELKYYAADAFGVQQKGGTPSPTLVKESSPAKEQIKGIVWNKLIAISEELIDRGVDKFFYEILPDVWQDHIVPFCRMAKKAMTEKNLRIDVVQQQSKTSKILVVKPKKNIKMTREEANNEKRKVLYHWLGLLDSLTKLQNAGEVDAASTLKQLTNPATLNKVNGFLSENPNLLETDRYILLHNLLGRDLYKEGCFFPIEATEIKKLVTSHRLKMKSE